MENRDTIFAPNIGGRGMGQVDSLNALLVTLTFFHILWVGTPGAVYAAYAARRQRRYRQSSPDLLQVMSDESSDESVYLQRFILFACVVSPIAMIVNESAWWFPRIRARLREFWAQRSHLSVI
jgi:hypothetical protein